MPESIARSQNGVNVPTDAFTLDELSRILQKLKQGKACGHDNIPPKFWKFVQEDENAMIGYVY